MADDLVFTAGKQAGAGIGWETGEHGALQGGRQMIHLPSAGPDLAGGDTLNSLNHLLQRQAAAENTAGSSPKSLNDEVCVTGLIEQDDGGGTALLSCHSGGGLQATARLFEIGGQHDNVWQTAQQKQ